MKREDLNLDYGHSPSDAHEGSDIKKTLLAMSKHMYDLYVSLNDGDDLPQWCHHKLASSKNDLRDVSEYLTSKIMKLCIDNQIPESVVRHHIRKTLIKS